MHTTIRLQNISVQIDDRPLLKNLNLSVEAGQIHAIMGPNGSGKSSLAYAIMGHPNYHVVNGTITCFGKNIESLSPDKRAKLGIFLAFQYPHEIPGATVFSVLKESYVAITGKLVSIATFSALLFDAMDCLQLDHEFAYRSLNEGFSGGEKKKFEILQMLVLKPRLVILDEIDSGLDIDALRVVAQAIVEAKKKNPHMSLIIITHYLHILHHITPDKVHILHKGTVTKSGDFSLATQIQASGYDGLVNAG